MIRQLLSEGEESLIRWKKQLAQALGDNGQVIIDMLPDLEMIIGEQPEAPELAPEENRNRFRLVFQNFIRVFTSPEHPLVLFLDDLQWADSSSLTLIEDLLRDYEAQGFLLIGAYRDHEAEGGPLERVHPLRQWIENLKEHQLSIEELQLLPLELSHVKQLLQETFRENEKVINDLAELCHSKTGGNPFFLTRFLESLYQEKLIIFDPEKGRWHWDLECVQKQAFTGNVVELMVNKIQKLPDETIQALSHAAIFGNRFPLHLLSLLYEHSPAQTSKILWPALKEELILPTDQTYKLIDEESELLKVIYLFAHDRIQKAAYSLNEAKRLPQLHLKAGYLLKEQLNEGEQEELFFEMVNHLNQSISLVTEPEKRWELIALNLRAGQKAQLASAYRPSLNYLLQGISLLRMVSPDEASWTSNYSLTLNLYQYAVKSAYMLGEYEQMEVLINTALGQISSVLDQCVFQQIKISSLSARHEFQRVIEIGLETLNALGVVFPKSPNKGHVLLGLLQTKFRLRNKVLARLPNAPRMIDPDMLEAMKILEIIGPIAYQTSPDLFVLIVFQIIHLSLQHGIAPASSSGFTACGIILCGLLKEMDTGNRVGQIALYLNQKFDFVAQNAKSKFIFHQFIAHWKTHPNQSLPGLRESYQDGIEVGDIEFAAYAICSIPGYVFLTGSSLEEAQAEASTTLKIVESLNQQTPLLYVRMGFSAISQLMEDQDETSFQELDDEILQELYNANDQTGLSTIFTYKLITAYLFEKHTQAQEYAAKITHPDTLMGLALFATLSFYDALNRLSLAAQQQGKKNKKLLRIARKHQKNLKAWGKHAPMTYQHKWDLVEAEWQKNLKNPVQAAKHYNRAIDGARKNEFLHEEALANELAGRFYLENSQEFIAMAYLKQAHYLYDRWGAKAKVKQLNQQYKTFLATHAEPSQTSRSTQSIQGTVSVTNTSQRKDLLDLGSIFKSSQTISGEIQLEQLLSKLMRIVIENAGAQKGFLLLKKEKQFWIEAQGVVDQEEIAVLQSIPMDSGLPLVPQSIIHYVARSKEYLVLDDASRNPQYATDPYIAKYQPKSVLCAPILRHGKLAGVMYLENNLTTGAFSADRLEVLKLLSSQSAISIENAILYSDLKNKNEENAQLIQIFEKFVPKQFLKRIAKEGIENIELGKAENTVVTVLFSDIRSFTELSEQMSPQKLLNFLNSYLNRMNRPIHQHNGFIDKFIGDAILALFDRPDGTDADEATDAVQAAIGMREALTLYNQHRENYDYPPVAMGIGIHTGNVVIGTVGSEDRMDSTVLGDTVNLASRLEGLTKKYGATIIISLDTLSLLKDTALLHFRQLDKVKVKGKTKPTDIYEIFDCDPPEIQELKSKTSHFLVAGLYHRRNQDWDKALTAFQKAVDLYPEDPAVQYHIKYCLHLRKNPPPEDWDGAMDLTEK